MLLLSVSGFLSGNLKAQSTFNEYMIATGKLTLYAGDTIQFLTGSLSGQFVHVFYMVGSFQKRRAPFSSGYYSELIIDHFLRRKDKGLLKTYTVMAIPNRPQWEVWALLDEALNQNEIKLKSR